MDGSSFKPATHAAAAGMGMLVVFVVDDIDALHDTDRRVLVWESLRTLRDRGITVIAAASTPVELTRLGWDVAPTHIALPD